MVLRNIESYPPQEPFTEIGGEYHLRVQELGADVAGSSFAYGDDPYQEVAVFPASKPDGRVVVFMHGGGWTNGYKEWMAFMAPALNAIGITFVSLGIGWRLPFNGRMAYWMRRRVLPGFTQTSLITVAIQIG